MHSVLPGQDCPLVPCACADGSGCRGHTPWQSKQLQLSVQSNVNKSWSSWQERFMQIMHECIPSGTIPSRRNRPWLTKLIQAIRRRNSIYKQPKATNNFTKYRQYRNKVVGMLRNAKMAYFGKLNPRKS